MVVALQQHDLSADVCPAVDVMIRCQMQKVGEHEVNVRGQPS